MLIPSAQVPPPEGEIECEGDGEWEGEWECHHCGPTEGEGTICPISGWLAWPWSDAAASNHNIADRDVFAVALGRLRHPKTVLNGSTGDSDVFHNGVLHRLTAEDQPACVVTVLAVRCGAPRGLKRGTSAHRVAVWVSCSLDPDIV